MVLQLIIRNLKSLIRKDSVAFWLFIIGIVCSGVTIIYSFGKVYSMANYISNNQCYNIDFNENISFSECRNIIDSLTDNNDDIENVRVTVDDGSAFAMKEPWRYDIQYGSGFDSTSEPQIIVGWIGDLYGEINSYVEVDSKSYRIVGQRAMEYFNEINYASLTDDSSVLKIDVLIDQISSKKKIETIGNQIEAAFPSAFITYPEPIDYFSHFISDPQFYIAIALAFLALLNLAQLYRYFLSKRKDMYAIYQICGCHKNMGFLIFMVELELISFVPYIITAIGYKVIIEKFLIDDYYYNIHLSYRQLGVISVIFIMLQIAIFIPIIYRYSKFTVKQLKYTNEVE